MSRIKTPINVNDLVSLYESGKSVKALAEQFGVSRAVITNRLSQRGITPRGRSDSMYLRMAQTSREDRLRLTEKANAATRGARQPEDRQIRQAQGRERSKSHASPRALHIANILEVFGFPVTLEKACGPYNIDIAINVPSVAVEIQGGNWHAYGRHGARLGKRREYILSSGWHLVEVWFRARSREDIDAVTDQIITLAKSVSSLNPGRSQHWVLSGDGQAAPIIKSYGYDVAPVPAAHNRRERARANLDIA
jgi:very-short-patch-repair endonuclease